MTAQATATRNQASSEELRALLAACDRDFVPALSERQDIAAYAQRICAQAERFEHWDAGRLVGLVAVYCNDPEEHLAFVTNVSVLANKRGRGISDKLLTAAIQYVRHRAFRVIRLDVNSEATAARRLYEKHGFVVMKQGETELRLELSLR